MVRGDDELAEQLALLYGLCAAAEHYRWSDAQRRHAVSVTFASLTPR
jgi:hypothetical protein